MAPSDAAQARASMGNATTALAGLTGSLPTGWHESDALESGDLDYADELRQARMLHICSFSQAVMETALKGLIHALAGDHPDRTHHIGNLIDHARRAGLPQRDCYALLAALAPITGSDGILHCTRTIRAASADAYSNGSKRGSASAGSSSTCRSSML